MAVLTDEEVDARGRGLSGWQRGNTGISKQYQFETFRAVVAFVDTVAALAEATNHHPDIHLNYNEVTMALATDNEGGAAERDIGMAAAIDGANAVP